MRGSSLLATCATTLRKSSPSFATIACASTKWSMQSPTNLTTNKPNVDERTTRARQRSGDDQGGDHDPRKSPAVHRQDANSHHAQMDLGTSRQFRFGSCCSRPPALALCKQKCHRKG